MTAIKTKIKIFLRNTPEFFVHSIMVTGRVIDVEYPVVEVCSLTPKFDDLRV